MNLLRPLFFLGLAVMPLSASDVAQNRAEEIGKKYKVFGANNGQVYRDVTVTEITDAGMTIMHADGLARLRYKHLSAEQREKFGITEEAAEAIYAKEMKAKAAYEAQVAAVQKEQQAAQQKAQEELLAQQAAARVEAQRSEALRALEQQTAAPQNTTTIVSALEVPRFPIIRGYDNQILYPIQNDSRLQRNTYSRSSGSYPVYYGGTYYYPSYPSHGGYCNPGYQRGTSGWLNYRRGNLSISTRW